MKTLNKLHKTPVRRISLLAAPFIVTLLLSGVSAQAAALVWAGTAASTNWDIGTSPNWLNGVTPSVYADGSDVTFNDTATFFSPNLTASVQPNSVTINATNNYTFAGSGSIAGTTTLAQNGSGTLVMSKANTFSGTVTITNGILKLGANGALGTSTANYIYATNNGTLDMNHFIPGSKKLAIAGAGYNGQGALNDSSTSTTVVYLATNLTLLADATIGSAGAWSIPKTGGTVTGNDFKLTKVGGGIFWFYPTTPKGLGLGNIDIVAGKLGFNNVDDMGDPTKTVTVESNALLELYGNSNVLNKILVLNNQAILYSGLTAPQSNNIFIGPVTLVGTNTIQCNTASLSLMNTIGGTGGFNKISANVLYLNGTNTYSGPTMISAGKIVVGANSSIDSSSLVQLGSSGVSLDVSAVPTGLNRRANQALVSSSGTTTIYGGVSNGPASTMNVGNGGPGLLVVDQLGMSGCTNIVALGSNPTDMTGAVNSLVQDNGNLTLSGVNTFQVMPTGPLSTNTPYIVLQYSGSLSGGLANLNVVSSNPYYTFSFIDPSTTAPYLEIQVSGTGSPPPILIWKGGAPSAPNAWDKSTTNWWNVGTSAYYQYIDGDPVIFDDGAVTNVVNIVQSIVASSMTFSNVNLNYTFVGVGPLAGSLDMEGTGTVTLALSNAPALNGTIINNAGTLVFDSQTASASTINATISDNGLGLGSIIQAGSNTVQLTGNNLNYYGTLAVTNGILRYNNYVALGALSSTVYATNNGTLDLDHVSAGLKTIAIAGAGYNGQGALNDSTGGTTVSYEVANLNLLGDATIGSAGRWDWPASSGTFNGNGFTLTKVGSGAIYLSPATGLGLGDIHIVAGTLAFRNVVDMGDPAKTVTAEANTVLELYGNSQPLNKIMVLTNGAELYSGLTAGQGTNHFLGPIALVGTNTIYCNTSDLYLMNTLGGTGGFNKIGTRVLYLNGTNTYGGSTTISAGSIVVGTNSSLGSSSVIEVDAAGKLDVSQPASFNLGSGQTLRGNGTVVGGEIVLGGGSTLAEGLPGATTYALTNTSGNLILQASSTNLLKVNKTTSIANDNVTGLTSVTMGGTLIIQNIGNPLAAGDSFQLFSATTYSGSFSSIVPAAPGAGLAWGTNLLDTSGTLQVIAGVNTTSTNIVTLVSSNQLTLSWPADHIGWELQVQTNAPTIGLSTNWVGVAGSTATNMVVIPIDPMNGSVFYRMVYPPQ